MRAVIRTKRDVMRFANQVADKLDGKPYTMLVKKFHRPRSIDQNAKMHVMFRILGEYTGHSESEIKAYFVDEFGPKKKLSFADKMVPMGTSEYDVHEASDMIEQLHRVGAEVGCLFEECDDGFA